MEHPGTVIIRTNQEMQIFRLFLESLWSTLADDSRVVFIDDASPYVVREIVERSLPGARPDWELVFERNEVPRGTAACVNQALHHTEGDKVFIVDTDLILLPGWQRRLGELLDSKERVGAVGGRLLYPQTGGVQHSGIAFSHDIGRHLFLNARPAWISPSPMRVQVVVFALCGISRQAIETVGEIDETYFNSYEDFDYCLRLRDAGFEVVVDGEVRAYHWELSNGIHRHRNRKVNLGRFWRLWGDRIEPDLWGFVEDRLRSALATESGDSAPSPALIDLCEERPEAERFRKTLEGLLGTGLADVRDLSHRTVGRREIWLPQALGVDSHRWPHRLLFLVGNFVQLVNNRYWMDLRRSVRDDDLVADLYGNVVALRELYGSSWPGTKIR